MSHLQRAQILLEQRRTDLAEPELRLAVAEAPDDPAPHALLALCLCDREQYIEATEEAEQAIARGPSNPFFHYVHGRILLARNRYPQAIGAIEEAIRLDPFDPDNFALLAQYHLDQRQWPSALDAAEQGLAVDAEHIICMNIRATALTMLGRFEEAGTGIRDTLARHPENAHSHANLGWSLLHDGQHKQALEHFREALRQHPGDEWARMGIVEALKAKNIIYGIMLRYFLWMSRLQGKHQWGVVIGAYVIYRILLRLSETYPHLKPFLIPLCVIYGLFAVMSWLADPLFNLLLRLNRFGRHVLSADETFAANCIGSALLFALTTAVCGLVFMSMPALHIGLVTGLCLMPLSAAFGRPHGWPRRSMFMITGIVYGIGIAGIALPALFAPFIIGVFFSQFFANAIAFARPTR